MNYNKIFTTLLITVLSIGIGYGQESSYWTPIPQTNALKKQLQSNANLVVSQYDSYTLDIATLSNQVYNAIDRGTAAAKNAAITAHFPTPSGNFKSYYIYSLNTFSKALSAKYPTIKSYLGIDTENTANTIRFTISPSGFSGTGFENKQGIFIIDKISHNDQYIVYAKKEVSYTNSNFFCQSKDTRIGPLEQQGQKKSFKTVDDSKLRKLRMAIATTGEYSRFHIEDAGVSSGTIAEQKSAILSAINTSLTRINGVFENEFALTMELVANNDEIIFLDEDTDNLTNFNVYRLIEESQVVIDNFIGINNYDIGHTLGTSGGGLANFNVPCTGLRAQGVTGISTPKGENFDINLFVHELGHQFGGQHIQNNDDDGQRSITTSVEPGSGSSIMGYAGISPPNIQQDSDDYFNAINIREMWSFIAQLQSGNDCGLVLTPIANTPPEISVPASSYVIPHSTPFVLTATADDLEEDSLTYCWEQQDTTPAPMPPESTSTRGPLFRSLIPKTVPERYFPAYETVLGGSIQSEWEVVPTVSRDMNFTVTVRDNNPAGGQNALRNVAVQTASTGPFMVTSQNEQGIAYDQNTIQTITWEVAGTTGNGINTNTVNILLSYDGGLTFPEILINNTINDGNEKIIIPSLQASNSCRIKIVPVNNVYYAINTTNFVITDQVSIGDPTSTGGLITVSPNPTATGLFSIEFGQRIPEDREVLIEIFDLSGKLVFTNNITRSFNTNVDISGNAKGLYILKIVRGNEIITKKILFFSQTN